MPRKGKQPVCGYTATVKVRCADCGFWFNRTATSSEAVCAPCRRGEAPPHGRKNTYDRGCRCDLCCMAAKANRRPSSEPKRELSCQTCGGPFIGYRRRKYCSRECWTGRTPPGYRKYIKGDYRRRARHHGVDYEPLDRNAIFVRDGWICGICGGAVDPELKYPDRKSASLDHVVPFTRGGAHTAGNVQCSHLDCNILKRDRDEAA